IWGHQQPAFVRAGGRVIGYSRRGYRGSGAIDPKHPGTAAGDLLKLANWLGLAKFHAVGSAFGAGVAAAFAMEFPERLASLTIACSSIRTKGAEVEHLLDGVQTAAVRALPTDLAELSPTYRAIDPAGHSSWKMLHEAAYQGKIAPNQPFGMPVTLE